MKTSNYILPNNISALHQSEIISYLREKPFNFIQDEKDKKTSFVSINGKVSGKIKFVLSLVYFVLLICFSAVLFM